MLVDVQLSGSPVVVDDLDDDFLLQLIGESEQQAREADRRRLRLAVHWAERHVVTDVLDAAHWSDHDPRDIEETIGGAGTPLISDRCVDPLAATLGVSARTAMQLMSDGLDLRYRLPRSTPAWRSCASRRGGPGGSPSSPTACPRSRGVRRCAARADRRLVRRGSHRATGHRGRRDVRPGGAGRGGGRGAGCLGCAVGPLLGTDLGRHVHAGDHRRHPDADPLLRPGQRQGPRAARP